MTKNDVTRSPARGKITVPALVEKIASLAPPAIIAICGYGGAGKSGLAARLGQETGAPVVGVDSFIIDRTITNYTRWEIMDFARLEEEVLLPFGSGRYVRYGHFDWAGNRIGEHRELPAGERLIVEGVGLFRPELLKHFSLLIWVACPLDEATRRGKRRDREEYGHPQDEMWDGLWRENDEACYREHRPEETAHFIVEN